MQLLLHSRLEESTRWLSNIHKAPPNNSLTKCHYLFQPFIKYFSAAEGTVELTHRSSPESWTVWKVRLLGVSLLLSYGCNLSSTETHKMSFSIKTLGSQFMLFTLIGRPTCPFQTDVACVWYLGNWRLWLVWTFLQSDAGFWMTWGDSSSYANVSGLWSCLSKIWHARIFWKKQGGDAFVQPNISSLTSLTCMSEYMLYNFPLCLTWTIWYNMR